MKDVEIIVACDVDSPFYGPLGASQVYGPQKGASREEVELLDRGLRHLAQLMEEHAGIDVQNIPRSGAAGGLGGGLLVFAGGRLERGMDILLQMTGLPEAIRSADLVVTGEGSFDSQSLKGKVVSGIAGLARKSGVPVVVLAGAVNIDRQEYEEAGVTAAFSIVRQPSSTKEAMAEAEVNLREAALSLAALCKDKSKQ